MSSTENTTISEDQLLKFKESVNEWLACDDDVRKLQIAIKERKKTKVQLTPVILGFMEKHKIDDLNTGDGKLKFAKSETKTPLNKNSIRAALVQYMKDIEKAEEATKFLIENRDIKTRYRLKRTFNKNANK